jgi:DNA-binding IclR family transcriptional regulator
VIGVSSTDPDRAVANVDQSAIMRAVSGGEVDHGAHGSGAARRPPRRPLEVSTPNTIVDPSEPRQELALVRERGYAVTMGENEIGLAAVGAPIRTLHGRVIAAVTASGPTFRITEDNLPELAEHVLAAASEISQRHGFPQRG